MFEWLAAVGSSVVLGSSTPGMLQKIREQARNRPGSVKERIYASTDIACVAAAVSAREAALSAGIQTHGNAVASAYTARATALGEAYRATSTPTIRHSVKKVWDTFNTTVRAARKSWHTARDGAWSQFRTAIKSCKASGDVLDTAHVSSEPRGE